MPGSSTWIWKAFSSSVSSTRGVTSPCAQGSPSWMASASSSGNDVRFLSRNPRRDGPYPCGVNPSPAGRTRTDDPRHPNAEGRPSARAPFPSESLSSPNHMVCKIETPCGWAERPGDSVARGQACATGRVLSTAHGLDNPVTRQVPFRPGSAPGSEEDGRPGVRVKTPRERRNGSPVQA